MDGMEIRWDLRITKCENGFRVNHIEEIDDDRYRVSETVFEEPETENGEMVAMQNLLYHIKEHFAVYYSKHNKANIIINIEDTEAREAGE